MQSGSEAAVDVEQTKTEDLTGACGTHGLPEAGVAVGVDCKLFDSGDAVGCSSVGCEEAFGGLPRPHEVA